VLLAVLVGLCLPVTSLAADGKTRPAKPTAKQIKTGPAKLTAKQIVQRNVAARGGLQAWRGVQSMVWSGTMEVGYADSAERSARYVSSAMARKGNGPRTPPRARGKDDARKQVQVPFVLEMKRPTKSRIEIEFAGKTAVQIYDGTNGWLLRPYLDHDDWEPFTAEQARSQRGKWDLDGPVIDSAAQGTKVEVVSVEPVDGHDAYKLKLTHKSGEVQHVWIDAKTFLDVKVEGTPRRMDGKMRTVWVTQRDFRSVRGVMVPFVMETAVDGYADTHRMTIEKVSLNPRLDDARFAKPRA
jgi:outer membrane lipoprotein-sorting protein